MAHQTPSLITLPAELILEICRHIYHVPEHIEFLYGWNGKEESQNLCALLRTHSRLREIATPILYTRLVLKHGHRLMNRNGSIMTPRRLRKRLRKIIATLKKNPLLADLIRSIHYWQGAGCGDMDLVAAKTLFAKLLMQTKNAFKLTFNAIWSDGGRLPVSFGLPSAPRIQKLACGMCWFSLDFVRQFPHLRVLELKEACEIPQTEEGDNSEETAWEHTGLEELRIKTEEGNIEWYHWVLKYFPSLKKLSIGEYLVDLNSGDELTPLDVIQSRHTVVTISRLLDAIQTRCPSIEMLHLAEMIPTVFELKDSDTPAPISMLPFPEFPNLTRLAISSHYLDYDSGDNPFNTVCRSCPRLQSLSLWEVQTHGLQFCDTLLEFAGHIAKSRQLGRDFAIYLKAIEIHGDWSNIYDQKLLEVDEELFIAETQGMEEHQKYLKSNFNEYWRSISERWEHLNTSVFRSVGISYKETLYSRPWKRFGVERILL